MAEALGEMKNFKYLSDNIWLRQKSPTSFDSKLQSRRTISRPLRSITWNSESQHLDLNLGSGKRWDQLALWIWTVKHDKSHTNSWIFYLLGWDNKELSRFLWKFYKHFYFTLKMLSSRWINLHYLIVVCVLNTLKPHYLHDRLTPNLQ